jgi:hypothetical protein
MRGTRHTAEQRAEILKRVAAGDRSIVEIALEMSRKR